MSKLTIKEKKSLESMKYYEAHEVVKKFCWDSKPSARSSSAAAFRLLRCQPQDPKHFQVKIQKLPSKYGDSTNLTLHCHWSMIIMALASNSWHYNYFKVVILILFVTLQISAQLEDHVSFF